MVLKRGFLCFLRCCECTANNAQQCTAMHSNAQENTENLALSLSFPRAQCNRFSASLCAPVSLVRHCTGSLWNTLVDVAQKGFVSIRSTPYLVQVRPNRFLGIASVKSQSDVIADREEADQNAGIASARRGPLQRPLSKLLDERGHVDTPSFFRQEVLTRPRCL